MVKLKKMSEIEKMSSLWTSEMVGVFWKERKL